MKLTNAIKKLSKYGEVKENGALYYAEINKHYVEFMANGEVNENTSITCIRIRNINDNDDTMTDYFAGVWCNNLTQALKLVGAI